MPHFCLYSWGSIGRTSNCWQGIATKDPQGGIEGPRFLNERLRMFCQWGEHSCLSQKERLSPKARPITGRLCWDFLSMNLFSTVEWLLHWPTFPGNNIHTHTHTQASAIFFLRSIWACSRLGPMQCGLGIYLFWVPLRAVGGPRLLDRWKPEWFIICFFLGPFWDGPPIKPKHS